MIGMPSPWYSYYPAMRRMFLVYPYFILANLVLTSVLLNVMIAFFVNAFVTKATGQKHGDRTRTFREDEKV